MSQHPRKARRRAQARRNRLARERRANLMEARIHALAIKIDEDLLREHSIAGRRAEDFNASYAQAYNERSLDSIGRYDVTDHFTDAHQIPPRNTPPNPGYCWLTGEEFTKLTFETQPVLVREPQDGYPDGVWITRRAAQWVGNNTLKEYLRRADIVMNMLWQREKWARERAALNSMRRAVAAPSGLIETGQLHRTSGLTDNDWPTN